MTKELGLLLTTLFLLTSYGSAYCAEQGNDNFLKYKIAHGTVNIETGPNVKVRTVEKDGLTSVHMSSADGSESTTIRMRSSSGKQPDTVSLNILLNAVLYAQLVKKAAERDMSLSDLIKEKLG